MRSAVLEGTHRYNPRPGFGWRNTKKGIRGAGSHRSVAPSSCPSSTRGLSRGSPEEGLGRHQLAGIRARDGFFRGLCDIPEASTCPSISRAEGQPTEDKINWFSSK